MNNKLPQIFIEEKAKAKMQFYSELAENEIGGLMEVEKNKDGCIIKDIILLEQKASGGDFHLDNEAVDKFTEKLMFEAPEKMEKICGWWHKHPCANWSMHDDTTFNDLRKYFKNFVLGVVMLDVNTTQTKKYKSLVRLEVGKSQYLQYNNLMLRTIPSTTPLDKPKLKLECEKEVKKLVKKDTTTVYYDGGGCYYGGFNPNSNNNYGYNQNAYKNQGYQESEPILSKFKINGEVVDLKEMNDCGFAEIDCASCIYIHDCISHVKNMQRAISVEADEEKKYLEEEFGFT